MFSAPIYLSVPIYFLLIGTTYNIFSTETGVGTFSLITQDEGVHEGSSSSIDIWNGGKGQRMRKWVREGEERSDIAKEGTSGNFHN